MIEQEFAARGVAVLARLAVATAAGLGVGVLTLWMQGHLAGNWNELSNSGATWTVVAVALAALCGTSTAVSAVAGTAALVGEVGGYYWCAAPWHGIAVTQSEQVLWTAAALVIGPFAGLAGFGLTRGTATQRVVSLLAVSGLLIGEGAYLVRSVPNYRVAAEVEIAAGAVIALVAVLMSGATVQRRAAAVLLGAGVAGAVLIVYTAPTFAL